MSGYDDIPWDDIYLAGEHLDNWDKPDPAPELVEFIDAREWRSGCEVVDLGCGTGSDAAFLAERGFSVSAVDISAFALRAARERHPAQAVTWIHADVCDLIFDDSSHELVVDGACLHHFTRTQWETYAHEVARILKPGGLLFVRGVSKKHRSTNILDETWIAEVFDRGVFSIESMTEFSLAGAAGRHAPGLAAVVIRT